MQSRTITQTAQVERKMNAFKNHCTVTSDHCVAFLKDIEEESAVSLLTKTDEMDLTHKSSASALW